MFYCKSCGRYVDVIVIPFDSENGVIVNSDGTSTNRYYDGIIGVDEELQESAELETEGSCINCGGLVEWSN